jgi:predicted TIM-barrel fold metal-dependent hydrolase
MGEAGFERIDADMHLFEGRRLWADYSASADQPLALAIEDDELGHAWLVHAGRRIHLAEVHVPGRVEAMGAYRQRVREGLPPEVPYDEALPREFSDPEARRDQLERFGLDGAVLFPNYGLLWERALAADLDATKVNMSAWNRFAVEVAASGKGRLHPVGHVTLRDLDHLRGELRRLSAGGVRLAMVAPALVDGKALSHPDLDGAWAAFADAGVAVVFHVANFERPFADAWFAGDFDPVNPVLSSVFLATAPALAVADLAVGGVFERHPALRLGIMELTAPWVGPFLAYLDGAFAFHAAFNGRPLRPLPLAPSQYVRRQVRVAALAYEEPARLVREVGEDVFMFSSDYPHAEGVARPVEDYEAMAGPLEGRAARQLYGGNLRFLLDG